jgi:hypothetical protein
MSGSARTCCSRRRCCWGFPPLLAVPLVGVAAAVIALPVSALLFRLRDAYFAIAAWVVAEVFRLGAAQTSPLGGGSGVSLPIDIVKSIGATREIREIIIFDATLATTLLADPDFFELHDKPTAFFDPDNAAVAVTFFSTHLRGAASPQPIDDVGRLDLSDEALC